MSCVFHLLSNASFAAGFYFQNFIGSNEEQLLLKVSVEFAVRSLMNVAVRTLQVNPKVGNRRLGKVNVSFARSDNEN